MSLLKKNVVLAIFLVFSQVKANGNSLSLLEQARNAGTKLVDERAFCQLWDFSTLDGSLVEETLSEEARDVLFLLIQFIDDFEHEHEVFPSLKDMEEFIEDMGYDDSIIKSVIVSHHLLNGARVLNIQLMEPRIDVASKKKKMGQALVGAFWGTVVSMAGVLLVRELSFHTGHSFFKPKEKAIGVSVTALFGAILKYERAREYRGGEDYPLVYAEARTKKFVCSPILSAQ